MSILGLSTAFRLFEARPGLRVMLLERDDHIGGGQSPGAGGVLHVGVHYPARSAKA